MRQDILIVDDDMQLTTFLARFLHKHGYRSKIASSAQQTHKFINGDTFSLIVLDLNLPDGDGLDIARDVRQVSQIPIIMLTARDEVFDRIIGLEIGADDYLTKPYEPRELLARIKAVLRRTASVEKTAKADFAETRSMTFAGMKLDLIERQLHRVTDGTPIPLTGTEFELLHALADCSGVVLSREKIMDRLYGNSALVTDRAIDAHVTRLRRKIDPEDADASLIQSVHGKGYVLAAEVVTASV